MSATMPGPVGGEDPLAALDFEPGEMSTWDRFFDKHEGWLALNGSWLSLQLVFITALIVN